MLLKTKKERNLIKTRKKPPKLTIPTIL